MILNICLIYLFETSVYKCACLRELGLGKMDNTRTRIFNAAGVVFAEKGYEAATVREICQKAGVNLAAINYYFGGKERLYIAAVEESHPARFHNTPPPDRPPGTPPETKLLDFIHELLTRLLAKREAPWQERLMIREILDPTPACRELLRSYFQAGFNRLQGILDEILPADTPPHKRHQIELSIIGQCVYYRAAQRIVPMVVQQQEWDQYYSIEQLAQHITQFSLASLGVGPSLATLLESNSKSCGSQPSDPDGSASTLSKVEKG